MTATETTTQERIAKLLVSGELFIETDLPKETTDAYCAERQPWRVVYEFSNGTRTDHFETEDFIYNPRPLGKLRLFNQVVDLSQFAGKSVLDVGFNEGYHSIFMSKYLDCTVDAIDYSPGSVAKVSDLLDLIGETNIDLAIADAATYSRRNAYDLILHLGTLYHLPDVWGSIANSALSLRNGGTLFLETITYHSDVDESDCRFINTLNPGQKNYWALSKAAIKHMFAEHGVRHVADVKDYEVKILEGTGMMRSLMVFQKGNSVT